MQDGSSDPRQGAIVPNGTPVRRAVPPRNAHGAFMLALGCVVAIFLPYAGILLAAYGAREVLCAKARRGVGLILFEGVGLLAVSFIANVTYAVLLAPVIVCSLGIAWCMWRGATVTNVSVVVVLTALTSLGIDAAIAAMTGPSLQDAMVSYLMAAVAQFVGTGIEGEFLASGLEPIMMALWPLVYVVSAASYALFAGLGSHVMQTRCTGDPRRPSLSRFDAPMWSVAVLAVSIVCVGASFTGFPEAQIVRTVSVTAIMSVRIIFACQGFGVLSALMARRRFGCVTRFICILLVFWSEMMFFAMSIVGLIDVWANFRKLERDGSHAQAKQ